jgi:hypothetical protein
MRRPLTRLALFVLAVGLAGCAGAGAAAPAGCQRDDQCGDGQVCLAAACLLRAAPPTAWDVELAPRSVSAAALTELAGMSLPADAFDLTATSKVMLTGTLTSDAASAPLMTAHIVLDVPSAIPGRPDLQFEADLQPASVTKMPSPTFTLAVPAGLVGRTGTLRVLPGAPDNATRATASFTVTVEPTLELALPARSLTVRGRLLSALGDALSGLVARAFQSGDLVSNVGQTDGAGAFALVVPAGAAASPPPLAVELEAATTDAPQPHFWAKPVPVTGDLDLGDIQLPAYGAPNTFRFTFHGGSDDTPIAGALVRARTLLADDAKGTTDFLRDGLSDDGGQATLSLLPGSTAASRLYDIAIVPPAGSSFATTCLETFPLVAGGVQPTIKLGPRHDVRVVVVGADGTPAPGIVIQATRTAGAHATACDAYASAPQATGTTGADGSFVLHLDPGTYTLDYDPPAGAPFPRLTETDVVVSEAAGHAVQLPAGAVVEGTLRDETGAPLAQAGVRFFGPACAAPVTCVGVAPVLEAQARADADGHYRAVIPVAP